MNAQKDLANLLLSLFSADELRRWLRYLPDGDRLAGSLPGANASPALLASEAVMELQREGMIDQGFWDRMLEERPRRKADIDKVKGVFAAGGEPASNAGASATPATAAASAKVTVLLVSASPDSQVRLRVDREFRDLIARMRGTKYRDRFTFVQLQAARFEDLRTALMEHQPSVLHISAHGDSEGNLIFEGSGDAAKYVTLKQLTRLLAAMEGLCLLVLNACYSDVIAKRLPEVCGLAIGMSDAVADQAAIDFSVTFYESLGFGKSVETAFKVAVAGLEDLDDNVPTLFPPSEEDLEKRRKRSLIVV